MLSQMSQNYSHLPPHIIVNILKRLSLKDMKNAVLVCKPWYNASCCMTIARRIQIHFMHNVLSSCKNIKRPFCHLKLTDVVFNRWNYTKILSTFSSSIIELQIDRCTMSLNKLLKCIKYLPNLETLRIQIALIKKFKITSKSYKYLPNPLGNIKILNIACFSLQLEGLNYILGKCINLKELTYHTPTLDFDNMCHAMAQWPAVELNFLSIFSYGRGFNKFLKRFCELNVIKVTKLEFFNIPSDYNRDDFKNLLNKLNDLEELRILTPSNFDFNILCECLHNLRSLHINTYNVEPPEMFEAIEFSVIQDIIKANKHLTAIEVNGRYYCKSSTSDNIRFYRS